MVLSLPCGSNAPLLCSSLRRPRYFYSSASPEEKNISRVLTPVSTMLLPLMFVALALLQRKLRRKQMCELSFSCPKAGEGGARSMRHP